MSPVKKLMGTEEYLAGELASPDKHEYVGGVVYGMAGATVAHTLIASNVLGALHAQLLGRPCRAYNSDMKVRIRLPTQVRFYYPDVSVICRSNPQGDSFQDQPVVVIEVVSAATRRIDEGEKRDSYLTIPELAVYVLLEQDAPAAVVFRRTDQGFLREEYADAGTTIPLAEVGAALPLSAAYDGVEFPGDRAE